MMAIAKKSLTLSLDRLPSQIATLKKRNTPVITVCRSGARSGAAVDLLRKNGLEAYNGGPWTSLRAQIA